VTAIALAAAGLLAGMLLPSAIALIPDRPVEVLYADEPAEPSRTPYRELAAAPRLSLLLAGWVALAWAVLTATHGLTADLPAYLLVAGLGVAMGYVDVREHRLPDWLTYPAFGGAAVLLALAATVTGEWGAYGRAWLGALALAGGFLLLAIIRPADLGLGDVKLAASLGLLLGWIGWGHVVLGAFASFLLGGLCSVLLLATGRAGRRSEIPFGPFLLAGALVAVAWGDAILAAYR
jgi:leader peptidase (prepilin peptidase) / N-methyltransferase